MSSTETFFFVICQINENSYRRFYRRLFIADFLSSLFYRRFFIVTFLSSPFIATIYRYFLSLLFFRYF